LVRNLLKQNPNDASFHILPLVPILAGFLDGNGDLSDARII